MTAVAVVVAACWVAGPTVRAVASTATIASTTAASTTAAPTTVAAPTTSAPTTVAAPTAPAAGTSTTVGTTTAGTTTAGATPALPADVAPGPLTLRFDVLPRNATVQGTASAATPGIAPFGPVAATASVRTRAGTWTFVCSAPGFETRSETLALGTRAEPATVHLRLDPVGQLHHHVADATTGSNPKQVAFTPDGRELWVTLLGSRGVDVFSAGDGRRITTIGLGDGHGAVEVIFNRSGTRAYVSQMETASVFEIDTVSRAILRRMPTGGNWTKVLALSPDEQTLYAANWVSNDVSVIPLALGRATERIPTTHTPRGLVLSPDGTRLFVAGFEAGELERITLATRQRSVLIRTGGAMRHLVLSPDGRTLYADDMATATAYRVDVATEQVRVLARVDSHPNTIDLSPDGRFLYVSNRGENNPKGYNLFGPEWGSVLVIDTASGALVDAMVGGNQTTGLDVSPDGTLLAYTDFLDNRLALYRIPSAAQLDSGNGGLAPTRRALIVKPAPARSAAKPAARAGASGAPSAD